jgi:hypothetical protein
MVKEDQDRTPADPRPGASGGIRLSGDARLAFRLAAVGLVIGSLSATGFLMLHLLRAPDADIGSADGEAKPSAKLFHLWPRDRQPDLVLLLSGETFGYLQPCGCSKPQYGGLERRHNFLQTLVNQRRWPVVAVDVGDVAQRLGPQALIKYRYSMQAYHRLNYTAAGTGRNEMALPLIDALSEYALNNPSPRILAANLANKEQDFPSEPGKSMVGSWEVAVRGNAPKVGIVGVVAPSVAKEVQDPSIKFSAVEQVLRGALQQLQAQKPEVLVLLCQGTAKEAAEYAAQFPQFHVIQCLTPEDEPRDQPIEKVGRTLIIGVGHKGRYVGTVGAFSTGKPEAPWDLNYQLVQLGPEYETPAGQEASNPILGLLEDYTREVKLGNYLAQYPKNDHPVQREFKGAVYVGSEKCKRCHEREYQIWKDSPHSHAYETLEKAQRPSLRQYDGECIVCHVTGFAYTSGFKDEKTTPHLKENGCENCHGPGSLHIKDQSNAKLLALMNPYRTPKQANGAPAPETPQEKTQRINRLDQSCQKCHDIDNDVHWKISKWETGKIVHTAPPAQAKP